MQEFPTGSENLLIQRYEELKTINSRKEQELEEELAKWAPENDTNIQGTDPFRTIFVGRLHYDVDELELQKHFIKFGEIERVRIVRDKITNKPRGYAFVLFRDPECSKKAYREIGVHRGLMIRGRSAIVDIERGRTVKFFRPRRLGGGLGGRGYMQRENMNQLPPAADASAKRSLEPGRRSRFNSNASYGRFQGYSSGFRPGSYSHGPRYIREGSSYVPGASAGQPPEGPAAAAVSQQPPQSSYRSRRDRTSTPDSSGATSRWTAS